MGEEDNAIKTICDTIAECYGHEEATKADVGAAIGLCISAAGVIVTGVCRAIKLWGKMR